MIASTLRATAVAIAVAAIVDPPLTVNARTRARVAVMTPEAAGDAARAAHRAVTDALRSDFEVIGGADAAAAAVVVIGTDYPDRPPAEGQRVFSVTLPPAVGDANVMVDAIRAPREVPPGTLIHLEVDVDGSNVSGATSTLTVRTGSAGVEVARATHSWTTARERWRAALDVTPLDPPPWRLRVDVSSAPGERVLDDNAADALVDIAEPLPVVVYEPRLSWAGTFVRRALERAPRFDLTAAAYPTRGGRAPALTDRTRVVVVGGLDRLSADDGRTLLRFLRERGGAVVLLPDSRADAQAVSRWLPIPAVSEVLLEQPARLSVEPPLASIQASELLTFNRGPAMRTLANNASNVPVIAVSPVGAGSLLLSGALDAWRFRASDSNAFDRFWQAAIAGLAAAVGPGIAVDLVPPIVAPGQTAAVTVRIKRPAIGVASDADLRVSAVVGTDPVRLWPGDEPDTFKGSFSAPATAGAHRVTVTANDAGGAANFVVAPGSRVARPAGAPLSLLAESHGGRNVLVSDLADLARTLRQQIAAPTIRVERRPMRSPWWLVPLVGCLGGEWWLRRRRGER